MLEIQADKNGSLHMGLSENYAIELFPDDTVPGEYWRFFIRGYTKKHFVVTGGGILDG